MATGLPWRVRDRQAGLELVLVPPGDYEQGAHAADRRASAVEKPQHVVRIEKPFWVARFEVTNAQFRRFKPAPRLTPQPWWKKKRRSAPVAPQPPIDRVVLDGADQPAVFVSWNEAAAYCKEFGFRLPTEGEWEYFARAGMSSAYFWGEDATQGRGFANVLDVVTGKALELEKATFAFDDGNRGTAKVGTFRANGFGLFDVTGNAWEWCADWYDPKAYAKAPPDQRARMFRVCRGGSWFDGPARCRLSSRNGFGPEDQVNLVGFRVVRDASKSPPSKSGPATEGKR
ncbi:MAG: SUMF1/EgtB/PvdO family nonheme iron enzyme [Planctomycetes bacterium]|nr:SUMF1/EgtB/PvdO family nonheme iron enzyme [Planctomycetota bacterium]